MTEEMSIVSNKYVAHFPELSPTVLQRFYSGNTPAIKIPAVRLFLAHYKAYPCLLSCSGTDSNTLFHIPSILNYLKDQFGHEITNDIISRKYHKRSKQFFVNCRLCDLGNGIMICIRDINTVLDVHNPNKYSPDLMDDYFLVSHSISLYYLPQCDLIVQNMAKEFFKMSLLQTRSLKLNMICRNRQARYYLKAIKISKPMIYDLALHYGEKFVNIHGKIIKELNKNDGKGIVLLHGLPGSGKTHYIRYLIGEIENKTVIYVPPDMAKTISKPEFLTFLLTQPNSILIIEDAENIIRDRNEITFDASQAVANLLNLSDGLLGDAMHMQIIATFNCDLGAVDKALLRKGRLIANYEFGKLDVNNAKVLSDKLGFGMEHISIPMILAEIYNQNNDNENEIIV